MYCDAATAGLYLLVREPTKKYFVFHYSRAGKSTEMGLGPAIGRAAPVTLAEARDKATELRRALRAGRDPLAEKRSAKASETTSKTFDEAAAAYLKAHGSKWRDNRANNYKAQWEASLRDYASPVFGRLPVGIIDKDLVLKVLKPIWETKHPTARNLQNRIERVLDFAIVHDWRPGPNPAKWVGNLKLLLPIHSNGVAHHAAMPYVDVPNFMRAIAPDTSMAAYALRFLILTAGRSGEVRGAAWSEINGDVWAIPADRMKKGRAHSVPLSSLAMAIVRAMAEVRSSGLVFPGSRGQALSDVALSHVLRRHDGKGTVHGMRSAFRDWCGNETETPREIAEAALAHAVGNEVEQAYRRDSALEKRRVLMESWARYCTGQ
jgi:integrase